MNEDEVVEYVKPCPSCNKATILATRTMCGRCQESVRVSLVARLDPKAQKKRLAWILDPRYGLDSRTTPDEVIAGITGGP